MSPGLAMNSDELQPEMAEGRSPLQGFPISPGCFHPTGAKRQEFADIVRERVDTLLIDEQHHTDRRDQLLPPLDPHEWKQVQMSKELRFFKRIRGGRTLQQLASEETVPGVRQAVENGYSTMVCDGQVRGCMEDMMYGMTASSQEDLMTGFWYKNAPRDCVWLGTAEGPTPADPFHSADFIWALPKITALSVDTCYLKATGVEKDCHEIASGYLNVTVRGIFDLGKSRGKMAKKLVTAATKSFMIGLLNGVGIGLAKKLTLMARRNHGALRSLKHSELKTNMSADLPTNSTADESLDTDPFSRELDEADFCFSDEESNSSVVAQPDPSPNMSSDSDESTLTVWKSHHRYYDDDFIPATDPPPRSEFEMMHQTLFQLNIVAEKTLARTHATARMM
ncbi:hypothetical protein PHMEG_0007952 [Phytophthora megakarya]|uniref:Uncharacterized protein n=1 Tax=Phytophthora megakarya TaxID=4795 RepID=A0A225WLK1_9STRA|nr:hypothetical protein PHMEG_0007952 [Phytophthora megakarya]